jgi:MSHA biogenesis protein MshI
MPSFFAKERTKELAVVNLYSDRVEVAHVERTGRDRPVVSWCRHMPCGEDPGETLQKARRELNLDRFRCATVLAARQYQVQLVDAPATVPDAEMKSAVRWRLKDALDYPVELATVDAVTIPANGSAADRGRSMYAVSARNEDIEACMNVFALAKIKLEVIEVAEMAQRNLAMLFESDDRAIAMLSFSSDGGLLTFSARGELYLSRRIDITLDQLAGPAGDTREQLFARIALELQRSLDHFDRQFSTIPVARLMLAPLPVQLDLSTYLAENLSAPVESADLGDVLDLHDVPELREQAEQSLRWQTLGAALRVENQV